MLCHTLFRCNCWASVKISLQYRPVKKFTPPHPMCFRNSLQGWLSSDSTDSSPISLHPSATSSTTARADSLLCVRSLQPCLKKSICLYQNPFSSLVRSKPCNRIPPSSQHLPQHLQLQTKSLQRTCLVLDLLRSLS